jgi:hypothetical protein
MKSHEFLKNASAMLDLTMPTMPKADAVVHVAKIETPNNSPDWADSPADNEDHTEHDTMIAPLQQTLELEKKKLELPSYYDAHDGEAKEIGSEEPLSNGEAPVEDILDALKVIAGIVKR